MKNNFMNNKFLADFLSENIEKDSIIAEIFELFKVNCIERTHFDPNVLDALIERFNAAEGCNTEILEEIIKLIKSGQDSTKNQEKELLKAIKAAIDDTLTSDITLEEISHRLHISYYYMCHFFKDKCGVSLITYRIRARLAKAMRLLVGGDEKIADIAVECGFNSIGYFTETFTKHTGMTPTEFRSSNTGIFLHDFYGFDDIMLASKMGCMRFLQDGIKYTDIPFDTVTLFTPNEDFKFLHETAIIEYHGVLYSSWYLCPARELNGYTPICGKRSYDNGKSWSELEVICQDENKKLMYCPPVYGICDDRLYMMVNTMVAPDHIHSLELYILNNHTEKFELVWSRPIPFKLNTNVVELPNGKLMLPGRIGELDRFPNTPAVLISDSGKIDAEWRLVKISENGTLPDGAALVYPEISVILSQGTLYMFNRNDNRKVPLVYVSDDMGESWSRTFSHDIPYVSSKMYCLTLTDGRHVMICNTHRFDRSKLVLYVSEDDRLKFTKAFVLDDSENEQTALHYPCAYEYDGFLYISLTYGYVDSERGGKLVKININDIK